jgi:hypothetical protein
MAKTEVLLSKPIYIGAAVLDISKTLMFKFHYEKMRVRFGDKGTDGRLCFKQCKTGRESKSENQLQSSVLIRTAMENTQLLMISEDEEQVALY